MADLFDNPMGLCGFEFVEFASPVPGVLEPLFEKMGFTLVARTAARTCCCTARATSTSSSTASRAARRPTSPPSTAPAPAAWPSGCAMRTWPTPARSSRARSPSRFPPGRWNCACRPSRASAARRCTSSTAYKDGESIYDIDFRFLDGVDRHPRGHGFKVIDHLTHNVYKGRMAFWGSFYERIFNFREIRYFDIKGEYTGLTSRAMTAPDGLIRIPLNEESGKTGGQIEEFLMQFNGEGIQHIALQTDDLLASVDALQMAGIPLMTAPNDIYYAMLDERLPGHGEPVKELQTRGILMDGSTAGGEKRLLLQIFSQTMLGPVFFEFIQRKKDEGFGEGNFKALFESLERDQIRRGALAVEPAEG
jgi:4-hydroxyphenylpyruvate dioxygenase